MCLNVGSERWQRIVCMNLRYECKCIKPHLTSFPLSPLELHIFRYRLWCLVPLVMSLDKLVGIRDWRQVRGRTSDFARRP